MVARVPLFEYEDRGLEDARTREPHGNTLYSHKSHMGSAITKLGSEQQTREQETGQGQEAGSRTADYPHGMIHRASDDSRTTPIHIDP